MTDQEKLERIAELFGGVNDLAREVELPASSVYRRISGEIKITARDWLCVRAAVSKRVEDLQAALP